MIRVTAHGVSLRLAHRFDAGWWVRLAETGEAIGIITRDRNSWSWSSWPASHSDRAKSRQAAAEALVERKGLHSEVHQG